MGQERPPAIELDKVKAFVGASHGNLDTVQAMLADTPALAQACWDWGGGDFETALGAAAHTGSKEIAELLMEKGAPITIFAAAMLDRIDLVKAILADDPSARNKPGAHGIPLRVHAELGEATEVLAHLDALDEG